MLAESDAIATPAWLSLSCSGTRTRAGEPASEAFAMARDCDTVIAVGVNCVDPADALALVQSARSASGKPVVVYPNSGETRGRRPAAAGRANLRSNRRTSARGSTRGHSSSVAAAGNPRASGGSAPACRLPSSARANHDLARGSRRGHPLIRCEPVVGGTRDPCFPSYDLETADHRCRRDMRASVGLRVQADDIDDPHHLDV